MTTPAGPEQPGGAAQPGPTGPSDPATVVFDTTCPAYFCDAGVQHLLQERYAGRAVLPAEVQGELRRGAELLERPERLAFLSAGWWRPHRIELPEDLLLFERMLLVWGRTERNRGEAATLVIARRLGATAVLDDKQARRMADALTVRKTGTVGILLALVVDGRLALGEAADAHDRMVALGFRSPVPAREQFERLARTATAVR